MRGVAIGLAVLALASPVHAQQCAEGRVATEEGYCCWPGQRWDDTRQRCDGPPRCPSHMAAAGNDCVEESGPVIEQAPALPDMVRAENPVDYGSGANAVAGAPTTAAAVVPSGEIGTGWPSAGYVAPVGPRNPRRETRSIEGLQIAGGVLLGIGYVSAVVTAAFAFASGGVYTGGGASTYDSTCHDGVGASLLVPILGGLVTWGVEQNCRVSIYREAGGALHRSASIAMNQATWSIIGGVSSLLQVAGLAMVLGGSAGSEEVTVFDDGTASLSMTPVFAGALGARATLRF